MNVALWSRWAIFLISWVLLSACAGSLRAPEDAVASPASAEESEAVGYGYDPYERGSVAGREFKRDRSPTEEADPSWDDDAVAEGSAQEPSPEPAEPAEAAETPNRAATPLLIYTAHVHLAVFETTKALLAAEEIMRGAQGYLVRRTDENITFRVPAGKFQSSLQQVLDLGDVLHQSVETRDVTDEFHDVKTRLATLESLRTRLEDLLRRAEKVEDALAVERELERIIEQIERLKGRMKLLRELVAYSTISVEVRPRVERSTVDPTFQLPFPWLQTLGLGSLLSL